MKNQVLLLNYFFFIIFGIYLMEASKPEKVSTDCPKVIDEIVSVEDTTGNKWHIDKAHNWYSNEKNGNVLVMFDPFWQCRLYKNEDKK